MGRWEPHSVSPPMRCPETCPWKECVCGHHCLATAYTGAQEAAPPFRGFSLLLEYGLNALLWS